MGASKPRPRSSPHPSRVLQPFTPFKLIKYNVEEDEPVRDERGLCIPVGPGEPRRTLGRVFLEAARGWRYLEGTS